MRYRLHEIHSAITLVQEGCQHCRLTRSQSSSVSRLSFITAPKTHITNITTHHTYITPHTHHTLLTRSTLLANSRAPNKDTTLEHATATNMYSRKPTQTHTPQTVTLDAHLKHRQFRPSRGTTTSRPISSQRAATACVLKRTCTCCKMERTECAQQSAPLQDMSKVLAFAVPKSHYFAVSFYQALSLSCRVKKLLHSNS